MELVGLRPAKIRCGSTNITNGKDSTESRREIRLRTSRRKVRLLSNKTVTPPTTLLPDLLVTFCSKNLLNRVMPIVRHGGDYEPGSFGGQVRKACNRLC